MLRAALRSLFHSLRHGTDFSGRAGRREYLIFFGANLSLSATLALLGALTDSTAPAFYATLLSLALFLPGLALSVRRLHDTGRSGYWLWLAFTGVGAVVLLYWMGVSKGRGQMS